MNPGRVQPRRVQKRLFPMLRRPRIMLSHLARWAAFPALVVLVAALLFVAQIPYLSILMGILLVLVVLATLVVGLGPGIATAAVATAAIPYFLETRPPYADDLARFLGLGLVIASAVALVAFARSAITRHTWRRARDAEAHAAAQRLRLLTDSVPAMIWLENADKQCTYLNQAWVDFTGRPAEDQLGLGWADMMHEDDRDAYHRYMRHLVDHPQPYECEFRLKRADGTYRWLLERGRPRHDEHGNVVGYVGTAFDITDRRDAEHALRRLNRELEQRAADRAALAERQADQLHKLAAELTQSEHRERQRLARMLHDHLQQLLVAAQLRLAAAQCATSPDADGPGHLQPIHDLLDEAIDASRTLAVELAPPVLHQSGLAAALRWLAAWMEQKHRLRVTVNVLHEPSIPPETRLLLFQAVRELLFNVVKHAGTDHAELHLDQLTHAEHGPLARLTVVDHGHGMSEDQRHDAQATGFGLASVVQRIELLGGNVSINSASGRGTAIELEAPLNHDQPTLAPL